MRQSMALESTRIRPRGFTEISGTGPFFWFLASLIYHFLYFVIMAYFVNPRRDVRINMQALEEGQASKP